MTTSLVDTQDESVARSEQDTPASNQALAAGEDDVLQITADPPPAYESIATAELKEHDQDSGKSNQASPHPRKPNDNPANRTAKEDRTEDIGQLDIAHDGLATNAKMARDGRVHITINQSSRKFLKLLTLSRPHQLESSEEPGSSLKLPPPRLNLVIQVVGSRGDVQPFVALGKTLKEQYHHRVRLATHATFKGFVEENGLEFFNIGGDPAQLMAFMVKNPGLMPGFESLRHGDVGKRQREIFDILVGCWRSCIEAGDGSDLDLLENDNEVPQRPFIADVIIANPPSFAHIHCAEKLGIPVHLMFTMPWSPTQVFPHPLANVQSSNADPNLTNLISYTLVEAMTWQGLGHVINRFRDNNLRLEPLSLMYAPNILSRLNIPYTYCWSPALIPKPNDWGSNISISGFYFLSLASSFTPDPDLLEFLDAGPAPVYIGFGSIVVDDPDAMTTMIFDAIKKAGVRALVSKGWGGLGKGDMFVPEAVFMLGNIPHDWLFKRVSCVVHHGGAGTTAAGIALGKPTVIVPFFGDQPFWGAMIARAGAGPVPVPYKHLTVDILAASIVEALQPAVQGQAAKLAASIVQEKGTEDGARFFHSQLKVDTMRCSLAPKRVAVWRVRHTQVRLSALAATILINEDLLNFDNLKLCRPREYDTSSQPSDPISGVAAGIVGSVGDTFMSVKRLPVQSVKAVRGIAMDSRESQKSSNPALATSYSSRTLTPASTSSSRATTLVSEEIDSNSLSSSHTSPSVKYTKEIFKSDGSDLNTAKDSCAEPGFLVQEEKVPSTGASGGSLVAHISDRLSRSSSEGSSSTISSTRAPVGSRNMDVGPGKQVGRFLGGAFRSPLELTLTLARGFHNAPKLYGDTTVRQPGKVTDLQSGLKNAGKEFGYGIYDGISGLVTQPIDGARSEGVAGFIKGVGKGLGGAVLKPHAAILSVPGYTFKGIYKELRKSRGKNVENFIIAARTADGIDDWNESTALERDQIVSCWHKLQAEKRKTNTNGKHPAQATSSNSAV